MLTIRPAPFCQLAKPFHSFHIILLHAPAILVAETEFVLRGWVFSGFEVPFHGFPVILLYALTLGVAEAQFVLSPARNMLLGSLAIPLHRFHKILLHAFALCVAEAQADLSCLGLCYAKGKGVEKDL